MRTDDVRQAMYDAMKARRTQEAAALRLVLAALKDTAIEARHELGDDEELTVLQREAKRRRESEAVYREAGRTDLADQEAFELEVIARFLPSALGEEDLGRLVDEAVAATGAASKADLGKVMGSLMPKVKGRADGAHVRELVQARLGG